MRRAACRRRRPPRSAATVTWPRLPPLSDGRAAQNRGHRPPDRYARVPTEDQGTGPQFDELRAAGWAAVLEEHASGAGHSRPVLPRLLRDIRTGETLVVIRLDRLARSVGSYWRLPPFLLCQLMPQKCIR